MSTNTDIVLFRSQSQNCNQIHILIDSMFFSPEVLLQAFCNKLIEVKVSVDDTVTNNDAEAWLSSPLIPSRYVTTRFSKEALDFANNVQLTYKTVRANRVNIGNHRTTLFIQTHFKTELETNESNYSINSIRRVTFQNESDNFNRCNLSDLVKPSNSLTTRSNTSFEFTDFPLSDETTFEVLDDFISPSAQKQALIDFSQRRPPTPFVKSTFPEKDDDSLPPSYKSVWD